LIANPIWSDFPLLFYSAPQFKYLLGIEPMFGYAVRPKAIAKLERFRTGEKMLDAWALRKLTGAPFAFVSSQGWQLARTMFEQNYPLLYQGEDGYLFDIRYETLKKQRRGEHGRDTAPAAELDKDA
jgi:hypothetical protein